MMNSTDNSIVRTILDLLGNSRLWLVLSMIAAVMLRWPVFMSDLQSFAADTVIWAGAAVNFAQYGFISLDFLPTTSYGPYGDVLGSHVRKLTWPFMPHYVLAGFVHVFGDSNWAVRLLPLMLNLIVSLYLYLLMMRTFANQWWAVFGSAFFLFFPAGTYYAFQVADTQFWLLGTIAGYFHLVCWREERRQADAMAATFWLLFACASSWFGFLATFVASTVLLADMFRGRPGRRWSEIIRTPLPWLVIGCVVLVATHAMILINALGMGRFAAIYSGRFQRWTGGKILDQADTEGNWWEAVNIAVDYRVDVLINRVFEKQIPLYLSDMIAHLILVSLVLLVIRSVARRDREVHRSTWSLMFFFVLFYMLYILIFASHAKHYTHHFTIQMLSPVFVVLLVYLSRWSGSILMRLRLPEFTYYLPATVLLVLLICASWDYRLDDPTLKSETRKRNVEMGRLFGETISVSTSPEDLVLTNHQGFKYDNNIMRYTARRTILLNLYDAEVIARYAADPRIEGIVFLYFTHQPARQPEEVANPLLKYLEQASLTITPLERRDLYPGLTSYRLR